MNNIKKHIECEPLEELLIDVEFNNEKKDN